MNPDHVTRRDEEALLDLQLRVARRADELVIIRNLKANLNVHCWLLAEAEILGPSIGERGSAPPSTPPVAPPDPVNAPQ